MSAMACLSVPDPLSPVSVTVIKHKTTYCIRAADVEAAKSGSPLYSAVIERLPIGRADVLNVAVPAESEAVPRTAAPSLNVTVPEGVPPLPETVAEKVTVLPNTDGFDDELIVVVVKLRNPSYAPMSQ